MTASVIYVRNERYDPATHEIVGEVRTKLGRGPWSYWIYFEEDADDVHAACPSVAERAMGPEPMAVVLGNASASP